jgi:hypothetical protein
MRLRRVLVTYARKRRISRYDEIVEKEISELTFDTVAVMLSAGWLSTQDVSHHILLISPQSDRRKLKISIPTRYIYTALRDHLHVKTLQDASNLYQV